jgi:hypothetical protein
MKVESRSRAASSAATLIMKSLCAHYTRPAVSNLRENHCLIGLEVVIEVHAKEYVGRFACLNQGVILSAQRADSELLDKIE